MKYIIVLFSFVLSAFTAFAQDTIKYKDGTKVVALLQEVSSSEIRYKRFENPQGPTYVIPIEEVAMIAYTNGRREIFTPSYAPKTSAKSVDSDMPPVKNAVKFSGPRVGCTYVGEGTSAQWIRDKGKVPFVSQFGWQFETRIFTSSAGIMGLAEFVPLVAGLEQGMFLPSGSVLFGIRGKDGLEIAAGPNLSLSGLGAVIAVGTSFRIDDIYFPINLAFVPSVGSAETTTSYTGKVTTVKTQTGFRVSLVIGFNTRKY